VVTERTYDEHLEWCKERAREYLAEGDLVNAVICMMSDLDKHPETRAKRGRDSNLNALGLFAAMRAQEGDRDFVVRYIEGFR
jgi:hypothetical protein